MDYRKLGDSDLEVSRIILGTWALGGWMWGGTAKNAPVEAIHAALDHGINAIDTAPVYGFGLSEELVGKAIRGRRDGLILATKFGLRWDLDQGEFYFKSRDLDGNDLTVYRNARKESVIEECERSLQRLGVDVIDLYQCHWPDSTTPEEETMEALLSLRDAGKIRAFGVSNWNVAQMERGAKTARITSLQPPYSLLKREIEADILPYCRRKNIGVLVYSPMYRGLLTGKFTPGHPFPETDARANDPWFQDEKVERVNAVLQRVVKPIADRHDATLAQIAVAWCLSREGITAAIVGARTPEQAAQNAAAGDLRLAPEETETISAAFEALTA